MFVGSDGVEGREEKDETVNMYDAEDADGEHEALQSRHNLPLPVDAAERGEQVSSAQQEHDERDEPVMLQQ